MRKRGAPGSSLVGNDHEDPLGRSNIVELVVRLRAPVTKNPQDLGTLACRVTGIPSLSVLSCRDLWHKKFAQILRFEMDLPVRFTSPLACVPMIHFLLRGNILLPWLPGMAPKLVKYRA